MSVDVMKEIQAFEKARADYQASQPRVKLEKKLLENNIENTFKALNEQVRSMLPGNVSTTLKEQADSFAKSEIPDRLMPEAMQHLTERKFSEWKANNEAIRESLRSVRQRLEREANPFASHEAAYTRYLMEMQVVGTPADSEGVLTAFKAAVDGSDLGAIQFWAKHGRTLFDRAGGKASLSDFLKTQELLETGIDQLRDSKQKVAHRRLTQIEEAAPELENSLRTADFVRGVTVVPEAPDRFTEASGIAEQRWRGVEAKARITAMKAGQGDNFKFDETAAVHSIVDAMLEEQQPA